MIRRLAVLLYLALVVLLSGGVAVVGEAVSEYGVKVEERQSTVQQRLRQIFTERQESIEQQQQETAESAQIARRWRTRAVQLARYIERQGLSVPKPPVPLRVPPPVQAESPGPGPSPDVPVPSLEPPPPESPPVVSPPDVLPTPGPEIICIPLPSPVPDFCVEVPPVEETP